MFSKLTTHKTETDCNSDRNLSISLCCITLRILFSSESKLESRWKHELLLFKFCLISYFFFPQNWNWSKLSTKTRIVITTEAWRTKTWSSPWTPTRRFWRIGKLILKLYFVMLCKIFDFIPQLLFLIYTRIYYLKCLSDKIRLEYSKYKSL